MASSSLNINYLPPQSINISWGGNSYSRPCFFTRKPNPKPRPNCRIIACSPRRKISPWLMLPPSPSLDGKDLVYNFYSLGKDKVISFKKKRKEYESDSDLPHDKADFVGSSHGWIVSFQNYTENSNLFLTNPLTIGLTKINTKLPSPYHLPCSHIENVILNSPDPCECYDRGRAVMQYDFGKLAFCCPSSSVKWTPFGNRERYCSSVFSPRQNLFFCLTKRFGIDAWDLSNLDSPVKIPMKGVADKFSSSVWSTTYLAIADESDDLYVVRRTTCHEDPSTGELKLGFRKRLPYKTVHFDVYKYDNKTMEWNYMQGDLGGMAIFVGINNGFALHAYDYPNLKSDAVYFTDFRGGWGHDMGIFNYLNKTFSSCYYPYGSTNKVLPPPFWFTPYLFRGKQLDSNFEDCLIDSSMHF